MTVLETIMADVQGSNILLFIVLILLFVVGYKILQTVIRLAMIAIFSGIFLVVLDIVGVGPAVTLDRLILFMVMGTGLFIFYSSIATLFTVAQHGAGVVTGMVQWAFKPVNTEKNLWNRVKRTRKKRKRKKNRDRVKKDTSKEKAIILGEVDD